MSADLNTLLSRLRSQTESAGLVLFTGAGFSAGAKDRRGRPIPSVRKLKEELWELSFRDQPFDDGASLGDLYEVALKTRRNISNRATADKIVGRSGIPA